MSLLKIDEYSVEGIGAIPSAATVDLESATGDLVDISGTTAITRLLLQSGHERTVRFTGALTLTYGANLILPTGGSNITTAAGDFAIFRGYADGKVRCIVYTQASGGTIGDVDSVFGRTGVVVATNGDYTAANITNVPTGNIAAVTVQAALNELDTEKVGGNANDNIGYLNIPQNAQIAAYPIVLADSGKSIDHPATDANARTFTIPANASVAFPVGTAISFSNMTAEVVTIAITTDTMYLAGAGTTGSRSLAQYGVAVARKITSTAWLISGTGLT